MGEDTLNRIRRISEIIKGSLEKKGIVVKSVYLFGSYARGDYLKKSDIDLIVISDDWKEMPFLKRLDVINEIIWNENLGNVEVLPVTSEDVKEMGSVVLRDASRYWIRII